MHLLGLEINVKKLVPPDKCVNCLGVIIDIKSFTVSVPEGKLSDITNLCYLWYGKTSCKERVTISASLPFIHLKMCQGITFFLNRILEVLRNMG